MVFVYEYQYTIIFPIYFIKFVISLFIKHLNAVGEFGEFIINGGTKKISKPSTIQQKPIRGHGTTQIKIKMK